MLFTGISKPHEIIIMVFCFENCTVTKNCSKAALTFLNLGHSTFLSFYNVKKPNQKLNWDSQLGRTFSLPSQRNFPISFKPKVAIAEFFWKMQRQTWYSILGFDAMPLSLKNLLLMSKIVPKLFELWASHNFR